MPRDRSGRNEELYLSEMNHLQIVLLAARWIEEQIVDRLNQFHLYERLTRETLKLLKIYEKNTDSIDRRRSFRLTGSIGWHREFRLNGRCSMALVRR